MFIFDLLTYSIFFYAGWFVILKCVFLFFRFIAVKAISKYIPINWITRYGKNSYVLITGSSDGLGKAYAFTFASRGMNLILAARNKQKLESVKSEILLKHPTTKIEIYVCDFAESLKPNFYKNMYEFTSKFDVSIIVNNVGVSLITSKDDYLFKNKRKSDVVDVVTINIVAQTCLHLYYQPIFNNRFHRSAFIDIGSLSSEMIIPFVEIYSATKKFNTYFSDTIALEKGQANYDQLLYTAAMIDTPGLKSANIDKSTKESIFINNPKEAAECTLESLGRTRRTNSTWMHFISNIFIILIFPVFETSFSEFLINQVYEKLLR